MSRFHNTVEAEKLALGWHWFAFTIWLVELFTAALLVLISVYLYAARELPPQLVTAFAVLLCILGLIIFVLGVFAIAFHVKAVADHREHLKRLRTLSVVQPPPSAS